MLISYLLGQNVNATIYNVGTSGQTDYATLEDLRDDVTTWYDDDEIILHNDDSSLTQPFNFNGKSIKISGNAKVSPISTSDIRFSTTSSNTNTFLTITDGSSITFDGFNYTSGDGGAIYSSSGVEISGTNTFAENSASADGGAICSRGDVNISGVNTFSNNVTGSYSYGGEIFRYGNVEISGTSTFTENSAGGVGGAIFSDGDVKITASIGDIVFTGNKANSTPNAIYMGGNNKTLSLAAKSGNNVKFYDPIQNNVSYPNLTIKINEDQTGTVLFDMSNNGAYKTSAIYGNTTVYNGTLALKGEAV
ncbi:MAG: hypothetical protein LBL39_01630, partial [Planctomycetaceae bacterium]|nr:hypothetical protein [Planctomycetaceae bacterium]